MKIGLLGVCEAVMFGALSAFAEPSPARCECAPDGVRLVRDGRTVWAFSAGTDKPCVHPLTLPSGTVVTATKDADHPWHRGLWFSWKFLNGVNYWETDAADRAAGEQRVVSTDIDRTPPYRRPKTDAEGFSTWTFAAPRDGRYYLMAYAQADRRPEVWLAVNDEKPGHSLLQTCPDYPVWGILSNRGGFQGEPHDVGRTRHLV